MADNKQHKIPNVPTKRAQHQTCLNVAERAALGPQGNVPALRFPEFEGEWEQCIFANVCNIATGNKNTQDKEDDGKYPFYVRSQTVERINSYTFDGEAILTAGDGVGVGKVFHYVTGRIGVHQRVYILSNFKCSGRYLYHYFSTHFHNRVKRMSAKNSVDSVRMEMIAQMPLSLPSINEQNKIGHFLSLIENRIATQRKIIEDLERLKFAIRKHIFYRLLLKYEPNRQIRDVLSYEQPTRYIVSNTEYLNDNTRTPVLTANKAFILGYTDETEGVYRKGECIILDDFTLDCKIVDFPFKIKSSAIKILTAKSGINLRYIFEYIKYMELVTSEHKRHYIAEIEPIEIIIPSKMEMDNIAHLLDTLDKRYDAALRLLWMYQKQKQYLLSKMFI